MENEATEPETLGAPGPLVATDDGGTERGTPSLSLTQGGILDTSSDDTLERETVAVPERGEFEIVGGYFDPKRKALYNLIEMKAMSGIEEDLLGATSMSITQRLTSIMSNCAVRLRTDDVDEKGQPIEDITDPNEIRNAVFRMPSGSRVHTLIALRRTTHWKRHKDFYEMIVRCPNQSCKKESTHAVDLGKLDVFPMPNPRQHFYKKELLDAQMEVTWRVATGEVDQVLAVVADKAADDILTYAIAVRLHAFGDQTLRLGMKDWLNADKSKLNPSKRALKLIEIVKGWTAGDRGDLRDDFEDKEPGVDTMLDFTCPKCREEFVGYLNVGQRSFFFPSATSKRSKKRRST